MTCRKPLVGPLAATAMNVWYGGEQRTWRGKPVTSPFGPKTAVEFPPIHQWIGHPEVHRETLKRPNFADQGCVIEILFVVNSDRGKSDE